MDRLNLPSLPTVFAIVFACLALAGCGSPSYSYVQTEQVRSDFRQLWNDRAQAYRESLQAPRSGAEDVQPAGRARVPSRLDIAEAHTRGALQVIDSFAQFRQSEPVLSAVSPWLRARGANHFKAIRAFDLNKEELRLLADTELRESLHTVSDEVRVELAFQVGALEELGRIADDLATFNAEYKAAYREDLANRPPPAKPIDPTARSVILYGAMTGTIFGVGK